MLLFFARAAALLAITVVAAFLVSELLTDRIANLQALWWLPRRWFALSCVAFCILVVGFQRKSKLAWSLLGFALVLALRSVLLDWGGAKPRPAGSFRLVHWNASAPASRTAQSAIASLLRADADVIVLTDPGALLRDGNAQLFSAAGYELVRAGRFAALARVPIVEAMPLLAQDGRHVSKFVVEALAHRLVIEALDFPSSMDVPRYALAESVKRDLASLRADTPDIAVGDFNIPRGSASLGALYPGFRESFSESGSGWGATFPRHAPVFHIDLTLIGARWTSVRSAVVDPGSGRHAFQVVDLVPADAP